MAGVIYRDVGDDRDGVNEDGAGDSESLGGCGQDCIVDDFLTPIARLEKYIGKELHQRDRNVVGHIIVETLRLVAHDPDDVGHVLQFLYKMSEDPEPAIRSELMDHVPHIAMLCHAEKEKLLYVVVDHLLLLVARLLTDEDAQVRKAAQVTLLVLMDQALVPQAAFEDMVCPVVLQLTEEQLLRVSAVQLMSKMAPLLGREATERLFLRRFCELCQDPAFCVRKMCASSFGEFCTVVGQETTETYLLPQFVKLCEDESWAVRKECAEAIMSVSCACSIQLRKMKLAPVFVTLLWDVIRWVSSSAFRTLGPFISTFAVPSVADLVYNENRELVLMNHDGCEFRLSSKLNSGAEKYAAEEYYEEQENSNPTPVIGPSSLDTQINHLSTGGSHVGKDLVFCQKKEGRRTVYGVMYKDIVLHERQGEGNAQCYTPDEEPETQETDLDDDLDNKTEAGEISSNVSTPTSEWDYNSFQFWRVPIADVDILSSDAHKCSLDEHNGNTQQAVCSVSNGQHQAEKGDHDVNHSEISRLSPRLDYSSDNTNVQSRQSGPPQNIVPQELVEQFVSMTDLPLAQATDSEISHHCAFSLPAVALTLGRENWGFLRGTYEQLAADMQWKVRRTVASSIHKLAEILGEELASKDLVPIYNGLIKDLDEVRIGALKHLADFLKLLPPADRETFLPKLMEFLVTDSDFNWRFREELAQQILQAIPLFTPQDACTHLRPIAIALLRDKVAAVRTVALQVVTQLVHHITAEASLPLLRQLLSQLAEEFAHSTRWERRQTFALLCSHLVCGRVLHGEQFAREVMPHLLDLSWDRVPNVRLAVARTLASDIMAQQFFSSEQSPHQELLLQVLKRLNNDKDRDVRYFAVPRVKS